MEKERIIIFKKGGTEFLRKRGWKTKRRRDKGRETEK
jgi:hypothetical protein